MNEETIRKLREVMLAELSEADLRALCVELGLNFDELGGLGTFGKTRSILEAARERNLLPSLAARVRELRPDAFKVEETRAPDTQDRLSVAPLATPTEPAPSSQGRQAEPGPDTSPETTPAGMLAGIPDRVKTIGVVVAALVVLLAVLTLLQPRPTSPAADAEATAQAAALSETSAAASAVTVAATTAVTSPAEVTASGAVTEETPIEAPAAETSQAPDSPTPTVESTPTISESHPAAQTVAAVNHQLLEFYQGKVTSNDLRQYWRPPAYQIVLDFANRTLVRRLGVNLAKGDPLEADLQYVRSPALAATGDDTFTVLSREYWRYTNPRTNRSICETRDYSYILIEEDGKYFVREFDGELVSSACRQ